MASQIEKIIEYAKSKLFSTAYNGYAQKFVQDCYAAAGINATALSATDAYKKWCIGYNINTIPAGAAVYFRSSDGVSGHTAICGGNGYVFNPGQMVKYVKIESIKGFRGWGWHGGIKPGTAVSSAAASSTTSKTTSAASKKTTSKKTASKKTTSKKTTSAKTKIVKKDITESVIKSVSGSDGVKKGYLQTNNVCGTYYELYIQSKNQLFMPLVKDGITLEYSRSGRPSVLKFTVLKESGIDFSEGCTVIFKAADKGLFYGYVFTKKRNRDYHIEVTAYDQLRYFKNTDTYMYKNITASKLISMICNDYKLNTGEIDNTGYVIKSKIEDNQSLFDIVENALELTFISTGARYILYDDFGKICLANVSGLMLDVLIDATGAEDFDYTSSIDDIYTQVQVYKDNTLTGQREKYIAKNGENISLYGVLQKTVKCGKDELPLVKAESILDKVTGKSRKLTINNAFGDIRVRGGSQIMINLSLGDIIVNAYMQVERVVHTFKNDEHTMKLVLVKQPSGDVTFTA